jgi:hypothetical protein
MIGERAQTVLPRWRCDHKSDQIRTRELSYNYGVVLLDNPSAQESDRLVYWAGYQVTSESPLSAHSVGTAGRPLK